MTDFSPIDHKEKSLEDRAAVLEWVQDQIGFLGSRALDTSAFVGEWQYRFVGPGTDDAPWLALTSLSQDGSARSTAADGSFDNDTDRWAFNEDGSFSHWTYVDAMPEYGLREPTYSEDRYHVLFKDEHSFVLFNGDGSLIEYYERKMT